MMCNTPHKVCACFLILRHLRALRVEDLVRFVGDVVHSLSSLVIALCPISGCTPESCSWLFMNWNGTLAMTSVTLPLLTALLKYYQRTLHVLRAAAKVVFSYP